MNPSPSPLPQPFKRPLFTPPYVLLAQALAKVFRMTLSDWEKQMGEYGLADSYKRAALSMGIDKWLAKRVEGEFVREQILRNLELLGQRLFEKRSTQPERCLEQPATPLPAPMMDSLVGFWASPFCLALDKTYKTTPFEGRGIEYAGQTIAYAVYLVFKTKPGHPAGLLDLRADL